MTGRNKDVDALKRKITNLDERAVDEMYGLEPVYRPDEVLADRSAPTMFVDVHCPYCAEVFETQIDLTAGSFTHIEDCHVCCQPIELSIEISSRGHLRTVLASRMD